MTFKLNEDQSEPYVTIHIHIKCVFAAFVQLKNSITFFHFINVTKFLWQPFFVAAAPKSYHAPLMRNKSVNFLRAFILLIFK